jgi:hypothetical protein
MSVSPPSAALDYKFIEAYCKDRFCRPSVRKLRYLYFGLDHPRDTFVFSDTEDVEFKYCEPLQTTSLVKIRNADHLAAVQAWFTRFGIVENSAPMLFYFGTMMTALSKVSWGSPDIAIGCEPSGAVVLSVAGGPRILVARPIDTYFTLTKLQTYVEKYAAVFFDAIQPSFVLALADLDRANKLQTLPLSGQALYDAGLLDTPCHDVKLILLPGLDRLAVKSLAQKDLPFESGIRIWSDSSPRCLNYGGYYTDRDVSLCVVRDNVFVFPKPKLE